MAKTDKALSIIALMAQLSERLGFSKVMIHDDEEGNLQSVTFAVSPEAIVEISTAVLANSDELFNDKPQQEQLAELAHKFGGKKATDA